MSITLTNVARPPDLLGELHRRQPVLAWLGWASLLLLLVCLTGMAFDARRFDGVATPCR